MIGAHNAGDDAGESEEDVDVFSLAGPSDQSNSSDSEQDSESQAESESDGDWVMAESDSSKAAKASIKPKDSLGSGGSKQKQTDKIARKKELGSKASLKGAKRGATSVFASVEDYAHLLSQEEPVTNMKSPRKRLKK